MKKKLAFLLIFFGRLPLKRPGEIIQIKFLYLTYKKKTYGINFELITQVIDI